MKIMISDFKHLRNLSLLGFVLVVSACFPQNNEYEYDPKNPYYINEVREEIRGYDSMTDEEIFLRAKRGSEDVSYSDMDQSREIEGEELFAPLEGMVFTPLFKEPVRNDYERFLRLEHAVQILRNDVDVLIPKVFKMPEPQLISNIEPMAAMSPETQKPSLIISNEEYAPDMGVPMDIAHTNKVQEVKHVVSTTPPAKKVAKKHKPIKAYTATAKAFRRADHKDKTRVVIDLSADKKVTTTISGDGRRLIVDLSGVNWKPKKAWNAYSGQLISGYRLKKGNKLFIDLMYKSKITKKMLLKPNKDSKNYRLVIDLVSPHLHKGK